MATKCENCPLRQRDIFEDMSADEVRFMQRFKVGELIVDAGTPILMEGSNSPQLYTALHGMGLRYKLLRNGKRQVVSMIFPGDFIGLQAGVMGEMGHSVEATTKMTLCVFDRSEMWTFFRERPERAFSLTWLAAVEEHFMGEALSTVGQRTAIQAVAWGLARVFIRGSALGLVNSNVMKFPFKQQDLADALGLSLVHTNKTLAALRSKQLAHWSDGTLRVPDLNALADVALMDELEASPRPIM
ncbi:Crp/Fnr family transcriptional regulator [Lentibacter sp. XHP0401]|jgi:CRP-like cAMP-binding protein|uniref:Crp/Fnr family transcriptional regulator n=1 Tax=Lentibacter sp. XHP0401 TaxID=2984334 RepID=UPI0039959B49